MAIACAVDADVSEITSLIANTTISGEFEGVGATDQARAVRRWLTAEDDAEAIEETVDMVLSGVEKGE